MSPISKIGLARVCSLHTGTIKMVNMINLESCHGNFIQFSESRIIFSKIYINRSLRSSLCRKFSSFHSHFFAAISLHFDLALNSRIRSRLVYSSCCRLDKTQHYRIIALPMQWNIRSVIDTLGIIRQLLAPRHFFFFFSFFRFRFRWTELALKTRTDRKKKKKTCKPDRTQSTHDPLPPTCSRREIPWPDSMCVCVCVCVCASQRWSSTH